MSRDSGFAAAAPSIATKAELERLVNERNRPVAERHLTPSGPDATDIKIHLGRIQEVRISNLKERLEAIRERMEHDHAFARLEGRAKASFTRER